MGSRGGLGGLGDGFGGLMMFTVALMCPKSEWRMQCTATTQCSSPPPPSPLFHFAWLPKEIRVVIILNWEGA